MRFPQTCETGRATVCPSSRASDPKRARATARAVGARGGRGVQAAAAVRGLVSFAHQLDSTVIAEGVEDEIDRDLCVSLEVDLGQGWLFGRPRRGGSIAP